jgi:cell division protein FtsW
MLPMGELAASEMRGGAIMKGIITLLIFCVGALFSLGLVTLYSAGISKAGAHYMMMQLVWAAAGMGVVLLIASQDYRFLKRFQIPWLLLGTTIVLLVLVLFFGRKVNGARRWFQLGFINFQPSEMAKLALVIFLAYYCEQYQRHMRSFWRGLVMPSLLIGLVLGLIYIEPDRGATILLGTVSVILLIVAGARLWYILPPIPIAAGLLAHSLWHDEVRQKRLVSWLNPASEKGQVWHSMTALGSGGWRGLGLGNGRQKHGFVPDHHTDFILSVIGEELGLVATMGVVVAFIAVVICGVYISRHAPDTFGFLLGSGVTFLIGLQAAINIGVVTGALPAKGLPLPFISYGGSNLLLMLTCVGILLSIARHAVPVTEEHSRSAFSSEFAAT